MSDLFEGDTTVTAELDPNKEYAKELIGETGKYKTQEDAARALVTKDSFIEQLKRENAEMRETLSKVDNEQAFLTKLEEFSRKQQTPPDAARQPGAEGVNEPSIKPEDIEAIIEKREQAARQKANLSEVESKLKATFGDGYKARVQSQAQALGVSTNFLTSVAADNPTAFYQLIGLNQTQTKVGDNAPPRTAQGFQPKVEKRDYKFYQELRKQRGDNWYFSVPVQQEIYQQAMKLGDEFGLPK